MNEGIKNLIPKLASALLLVIIVFTLININGNPTKEAEKYVKSDVYKQLGVVADDFDTEILCREGAKRLVAVKFSVDSGDWMGSYCVYMDGKYVLNCTTMLPAGYEFDENLEELKALFGM